MNSNRFNSTYYEKNHPKVELLIKPFKIEFHIITALKSKLNNFCLDCKGYILKALFRAIGNCFILHLNRLQTIHNYLKSFFEGVIDHKNII